MKSHPKPAVSHISHKYVSSHQLACRGGGRSILGVSWAVCFRAPHRGNMGKKLDALLRRNPKPPKIKTLANLTIARIAILKNQRQVRCSHARSDVVQLLNLGHQDRALLRVNSCPKCPLPFSICKYIHTRIIHVFFSTKVTDLLDRLSMWSGRGVCWMCLLW